MSHAEPADLRVRRTRKLLRDALIALTTEKGFSAVTVGDITERAMVNRATFYRHYQDKYDLVMASIKDVLAELERPEHDDGAKKHHEPSPAVVHLFEHIAAHSEFYRVMLVKETLPSLESRVRAYVEQLMRGRLLAEGYDPQRARLPFELCLNAMASTALGTITWWLEHRMPYTPAEMALWLLQINMRGLEFALGLDNTADGEHKGEEQANGTPDHV